MKNGDISKNNLVDFQNTPIGFGKAIMIDDGLVEKYNQILDELSKKDKE
ncbi:hypothetical protein NWQ33_05365 [Mycoplasmopsis cynos]|nr:hypothetical protein [Mycoplasmopsis cynos]